MYIPSASYLFCIVFLCPLHTFWILLCSLFLLSGLCFVHLSPFLVSTLFLFFTVWTLCTLFTYLLFWYLLCSFFHSLDFTLLSYHTVLYGLYNTLFPVVSVCTLLCSFILLSGLYFFSFLHCLDLALFTYLSLWTLLFSFFHCLDITLFTYFAIEYG